MNDQYTQIKSELELTKRELEERLNRYWFDDRDQLQSVTKFFDSNKRNFLYQHIEAELQDVNRALLKMDFGLYGFCEETGEGIPYEMLKVLPTVRTFAEAQALMHFPYGRYQEEPYSVEI